MRRLRSVSLLVLLALPSGSADLDVQAKNGRVTLRVRAVPLVDVLERLSRETGLKLVYEGPRPFQRVTVTIQGMPESEALSQLFEGLGVNYAFHADPGGQRVEMLIIYGASGSSPSAAARASSPGRASGNNSPPEPPEAEEPFSEEQGQVDPAETAGADPTYQPIAPWERASGSPGGVAPGLEPTPPQFPGQASSPGSPPIVPGQSGRPIPSPVFPGQASSPLPAPFFPRDASNSDSNP